MPRIDPSQLLNTLSVLLAPDGGIRSVGEVPRIVQLMQKFSKKLVSKCIYVHILCSSSQDLLEAFLNQKGWDLLNAWFEDAYQTQNYFLCGDLIKLFSVCPMTPARLKENVEINQAPKLIRQLSCDTNVEPAVRETAQKVLQQWMSVIRSPALSGTNGHGGAKSQSKSKVSSKRALSTSDDKEPSDENSSDNDVQLDFDNSKDYNPNEDSDIDSDKTRRKKLKREDSTDIDDLLSSDEDEDGDDSALARFYKKRDEQKKKEEERRKEKVRRKEDERKSKSYSKTEIRDKLKSPQKERIKEIAKKMKEESKINSKQIASLGKIPKLPKSDLEKKNSGASFSDLLGGLDSFKSKPKAAPIKNKNKDLLESLDSSPLKPKPRSDSKSDKHNRSERDKERSRDKDRERERHKSREKERSKDKDHKRERRDSLSKSSDGSKHSKSDKDPSERPKPKIMIPEKRSHKDSGSPSPKEELKKSPKVIKESSFLGDILGDIMKEPPRKKKRRPSDVKVTENNLKELAEKAKAEAEKELTPPESEKENTPESGSGEMEFSEPTSDLPREVRGILVYVKGNKAKRKIQWRTDDKLVDVRYIEIEEDERVNVFKVKSFEEMKKTEAMMEKTKRITGFDLTEEEQEDSRPWRLIALTFEGEQKEVSEKLLELSGQESTERKLQESREASVLKALQLSSVPRDPSEPDAGSNERSGLPVRDIPLEDLSENRDESAFSYSCLAWPPPTGAPPSLPTNLNALLSNINPSLISSLPPVSSLPPPDLSKPPPTSGPNMSSEEQQLLAAQKAAAAALGFPSQHSNGFTNGYRGGQRGQHYQDRGFKGGFGHGHNNHYNRERLREGGRKDYNRPCKFWMERGRCKEEDRCLYPHPSR